MIVRVQTGASVDTERDLTSAERHVLQKLFLWKSMASSLEEFQEKKRQALLAGWNDSGPIEAGDALRSIVATLEADLIARLRHR
jgi:hypothetical protein